MAMMKPRPDLLSKNLKNEISDHISSMLVNTTNFENAHGS